MCRSKKIRHPDAGRQQKQSDGKKPHATKCVQLESSEEEVETLAVHHMGKPFATHPITLEMSVDNKNLHMELNTGAAVSIISKKTVVWRRTIAEISNCPEDIYL